MSFLQGQVGIVKRCAYETAVILAPGVIISLTLGAEKNKENLIKNSLVTARVSAAYFVSCISKYEISSLKSDDPTALEDAAFTIGSGIIGGFTYYGAAYPLNPEPSFSTEDLSASILMSTGYSLAFNYIPRPYLTAAIFFVELGTATLPLLISPPAGTKENFVLSNFDVELALAPEEISGIISGAVFSAVGLAEFFISSYYFTPPPSSYANESRYSLEHSDVCPTYEIELLGLHAEL